MTKPDDKPGKPGGGINPGGGGAGGPKDPCRPSEYIYDPVTKSMVPPPGCPGAPDPVEPTPEPSPPPLGYSPIYTDGGIGVFEPKVKTGIVADQYAKLLDVPYREAFMPGGPESSVFSAKNVMPVETKADPRPYSKTKQIPIRDLIKLPMRDATDAELLAVSGTPDEPMMSKDPYKTMSYQLDYVSSPGRTFTGSGTKPPGSITGPVIPLPVVGGSPTGGVFTPNPGGGGTYTGPGVNLPGPVVPLPVVGGSSKTGGNLIPLSYELGFTIDNEGNKIYSDSEGNPVFAADGGRIDKMDGGMMIIEDGVANDGIGGILKKYKEIRSEL